MEPSASREPLRSSSCSYVHSQSSLLQHSVRGCWTRRERQRPAALTRFNQSRRRKEEKERERERERARERTIIRVKTEHWYDQGIMGGVPSSLPNTPPPPPLPPPPYWFILKTTFTLRGGRHSRCRKNKSPECSTEIQTQLQETASFIYSAKEKYSQGNITFSMMIIKT